MTPWSMNTEADHNVANDAVFEEMMSDAIEFPILMKHLFP